MRLPNTLSLEEIREVLRQMQDRINFLPEPGNSVIDLKGRRFANVGRAVGEDEFVTKRELTGKIDLTKTFFEGELDRIPGPDYDLLPPGDLVGRLDMSATANGKFVAVWTDPVNSRTASNNTIDGIAEQWSTSADFTTGVSSAFWPNNHRLEGFDPNKGYYFRFSLHNKSQRNAASLSSADVTALNALGPNHLNGWAAWTYVNTAALTGAGGSLTIGDAVLVSSGNPYGLGTDDAVPTGLTAAASANGMKILFGVSATTDVATTEIGQFAVGYTADPDVTTMDLSGAGVIWAATFSATFAGATVEMTADKPGRYFYSARLWNRIGWSAWTTSADLTAVTQYIDTKDNFDAGPPQTWTVTLLDSNDAGSNLRADQVQVKATRPVTNGNTLLRWVWQIKDTTSVAFVELDSGTAPSSVKYDGSAIAHKVTDGGTKISKASGVYSGVTAGDLVLVDVRGGAFDDQYCQWATVVDNTTTVLTIQGHLRTQAVTDIRIKVVEPPWNWTTNGYLGSVGMGGEWIQGRGDEYFVSPPITLGNVTLANLEARVWFENHYCCSSASTAGGSSTPSANAAGVSDALNSYYTAGDGTSKRVKIDNATGIQVYDSSNVLMFNVPIADAGAGYCYVLTDTRCPTYQSGTATGTTTLASGRVIPGATPGAYIELNQATPGCKILVTNVPNSVQLQMIGSTSTATLTGNMIVTGDLYFNTAGGGLPYGEISYHGAGTDTAVNTASTWVQFLGFDTDGSSNLTTPAHGSDHITVSKTGIYLVTYSLSVRSALANTYMFVVSLNNGTAAKTNSTTHQNIITAGKLGVAAISVICPLTANDTVELWMQRIDGPAAARTLTAEHAVLNITMIGG